MSDIVDDDRESLKAIISAFSFGLRFQNLGKYLFIKLLLLNLSASHISSPMQLLYTLPEGERPISYKVCAPWFFLCSSSTAVSVTSMPPVSPLLAPDVATGSEAELHQLP